MHSSVLQAADKKISVTHGLAWTIFRLKGAVVRKDILQAIEEWFPRLELPDVVWDLTDALITGLTRDDFEAIALATKVFGKARSRAKTVFVADNPATYAAIGVYTGLVATQDVDVDYCAFRTLTEAERWLVCSHEHQCGVAPHGAGDPACPRLACRTIRFYQSYKR
ncbi:MAG: hypothetical protein QM790_13365 [Nibricoccus sp.]